MIKQLKKLMAWYKLQKVDNLYSKKDYLDAYSRHTDIRIDYDHKSAIGGDWEELGELQFGFLVDEGLKPTNTFLDIGMGTLRGGRHFIKYLDSGKYTGFDISQKAVDYSKDYVKSLNLENKNPKLLLNESKRLDFNFLNNKYDFILAQSVLTHLLEEHIIECFENLHKIMNQHSRFYYTILESDKYEIKSHKDVFYPISFFQSLSDKYGFELTNLSDKYKHPKGQKMLLATLKT